MRIANIENMKLEELEALEASIQAELQSRYFEAEEDQFGGYYMRLNGMI
jgi:hypothetical protein